MTTYTLSWNKKSLQITVYRKFPIYIGSFQYIHTTKYPLSWNKKHLQNMSEIFDMVHMSQVGNLAEVSRDFRDIIS